MRILITALCFMFLGLGSVSAQKIGHVNTQDVLPKMSAYKAAQSRFEAYAKQLQKQLQAKEQELQLVYNEAVENAQGMSEAARKAKEQEIVKLQEELQKQQASAQDKLARKEQELMKPVYDKFNASVKKAATAKGVNYVLDKSTALYSSGGTDLTPMVKIDLGIK